MLLLSKSSAYSIKPFIWCNSAQGSLPGPCGSLRSPLVPPSTLITTKPSCAIAQPGTQVALDTEWLWLWASLLSLHPAQVLCLSKENRRWHWQKCWRGGDKSCWRRNEAAVRCDSVACHPWLIRRGETKAWARGNTLGKSNTLWEK